MDEQNNQNPEEQELPDKALKKGEDMLKDAGRKAGQKYGKIALKALLPNIFILIGIVLAIVMGVTFIGSAFYAISNGITKIANSIETVIKLGDNGPIAPTKKEVISSIEEELKNIGISKTNLGMGNKYQTDEYLYKFKITSLATQIPYVKDGFGKTLLNILADATGATAISTAIDTVADAATGGSAFISEQKDINRNSKNKKAYK